MQSESIKSIIPALIKVQGEITNVAKNADNPFFKSKYADLPTIIEHTRKLLADNGLVIVQTNEPHDSGIVVVTTLYHSSGEWIQGKLRLTPTKNDPQQCGSAITYGRRYALASILNIAQEDDDGNLASKKFEQVCPEPVNHKLVAEVEKELRKLIDESVDWENCEAMREQFSKLSNDEKIALGKKMEDTVPTTKRMYKNALKDYLSHKEDAA